MRFRSRAKHLPVACVSPYTFLCSGHFLVFFITEQGMVKAYLFENKFLPVNFQKSNDCKSSSKLFKYLKTVANY